MSSMADPFGSDANYPASAPSFPAPPADVDPLLQQPAATQSSAPAASSSQGAAGARFPAPPGAAPGATDFAPSSHAPASAAGLDPHANSTPANVEFFPRTPLYNDRVLPLSIIALLPLVPAFGSFPVAVVAVVGMAATYIADMLNFRRTTIALLVATLAAIWIGFYLGSFVEVWGSAAPFVVLLNASLLMLLLATWALVHVRWVVLKFPELAVRCERAVMALLPFAAIPSLVSTCAALAGSRHAAFAFAIAMCVLHRLFYWRRPSSFAIFTASLLDQEASSSSSSSSSAAGTTPQQQTSKKNSIRDVCFVIHRPEAVLFTLLTLLLPMFLHCCFVWPTVSRSMLVANAASYSRWLLSVNACGLVAIPAGYLIWYCHRALWFLRTGVVFDSNFVHLSHSQRLALSAQLVFDSIEKHRVKVGVAAYLLGMFFGISRVMHSRYSFYFSGFIPPFNSVVLYLIGCALPVMYLLSRELYNAHSGGDGGAAGSNDETTNLVIGAALGTKNRATNKKTPADLKKLWGINLMLSIILTVAFTLTLGMPPFFVLTSTMSVAALWAYLVDRKRNGAQYTMFIFCSAIGMLWWMFLSFSFIVSDLKVFGEEGVIPVPLLAGSMLWVYIFGAWLIPLSFQKEAKGLLTFVLVFHSQKVLWIERVLYSQHEESTYPVQFVLATSAAGCYAMHRLYKHEVLPAGPASVVLGAYVSKILVYFSDSVEIDYRFSSGSSASAIVRETFLSYSSWALVSLMLYTYMRLVPDLKRVKAARSGGSNKKAPQQQQQQPESIAADGNGAPSDQDDFLSAAPSGLEHLLAPPPPSKPVPPPSQKEALAIINWVRLCAFFVALTAFVFFVSAAPTIMRWFVEDVLRVHAPSRMQLIGAALTAASLTSWYWCGTRMLSKIEQATVVPSSSSADSSSATTTRLRTPSSAATKTFAGLTVFCLCMTLLDPPVEALVDVLTSGEANSDYDENDNGLSFRSETWRVRDQHLLLPDLPFQAPWWSRWAMLLSLGFGIFVRVFLAMMPKHDGTGSGGVRIPVAVRIALWTILGVGLGLAVTGSNVIIADWKVYIAMCIYFVLTLVCLDQTHYNKLENTEMAIVLFIGALVSFVAAIFLLNQVDIFAITKHEAYLLDGVFASRAGAIGVLAVVSFAVAGALKCRISGFSLLPHPTRIESVDAISQIALVLTSSCALSSVSLVLLSMLLGAGSGPLLLMAGGVLLLIDDRGWGFGLERGLRRYFISFLVVSLCMWVKAFQEAAHLRTVGGTKANMLPYLVASLLCVPSQLVVMWVLWRGGSFDANAARSAAKVARGIPALVLLLVDLVVVIFTVSTNLRLVAGLNLIGHITRLSLFEGLITKAREQFL